MDSQQGHTKSSGEHSNSPRTQRDTENLETETREGVIVMTTREEAIHACLIDSSVYPDTPFHDANWTIIRHQENQKMFAAVYQRKGQTWMNVKVEPLTGDFLRQTYPAAGPAYHMNKTHWISLILDGSLEDSMIQDLIWRSYLLTAPRRKNTTP